MHEKNPLAALEYEILAEKAAALRVSAERLTASLVSLSLATDDDREALTSAAAVRAWSFIVQREAMGLTHHDEALAFYQVPAVVRARL